MRGIAALFLMLFFAQSAHAALPRAVLDSVRTAPPPFAALPADLSFTDESGARVRARALLSPNITALVFVDYHCTNLCGVGLPLLAGALAQAAPDACRIVAIGLDPTDGPADAIAFRRDRLSRVHCDVSLLTSTPAAVRRATSALGYHYVYDRADDIFAHDASAYLLRANGSVAGVVGQLALNPQSLRTALSKAQSTRDTFVAQAFRCVCYALDAAQGIYTRFVLQALQLAGVIMLLVGGLMLRRLMRERAQ